MRIIAGEYKGRIIEMPKGIRPTSDKVRESLFEILKNRVEGAVFLDLYSGSGAMGIEALSRGAKKVVFIDSSRNCISVLKKNLGMLGTPESSYDIYSKDCIDGIKTLQTGRGRLQSFPAGDLFGIVFFDPPYHTDLARNTLIGLSNCDILTPNALVIAEVFKKEGLPEESGIFKKIRSSKYGDTLLEFFRK
ncbi:MAG: 16S rRNA (guanine(966)-N(2))-methyltransferase RsmD [Candidatus Omnitrophota bacterium]|nr:16S rRNA (guanine(966)-N(2))-methyltransferase RsmD [Candidatus Omnitrophota bacterium]